MFFNCFKNRHSCYWPNLKTILADLLLCIGIGLLVINAIITHMRIHETAIAEQSPIEWLSNWQPDKDDYFSGDVIRFTVTRTVEFEKGKKETLLVTLDSYRNLDTGEIYPGAVMGRVVTEPGEATVQFARRLPNFLKSGTYRIEGWELAATARRTLPAAYYSESFTVQNVPRLEKE